MDNACKYTVQGKIAVVFSCEQRSLRIQVDDTGPGLPPERQQAIYEPFKQASGGYTRQYEGMGLGLSVASSLAAVLGGSLLLDTAHTQGCHFVVSLPLPVMDDFVSKPVKKETLKVMLEHYRENRQLAAPQS